MAVQKRVAGKGSSQCKGEGSGVGANLGKGRVVGNEVWAVRCGGDGLCHLF